MFSDSIDSSSAGPFGPSTTSQYIYEQAIYSLQAPPEPDLPNHHLNEPFSYHTSSELAAWDRQLPPLGSPFSYFQSSSPQLSNDSHLPLSSVPYPSSNGGPTRRSSRNSNRGSTRSEAIMTRHRAALARDSTLAEEGSTDLNMSDDSYSNSMNGLSGNSDVYPGHVSPHGPTSHGSPGSTYSGGFPFPSHGPSRNGLHLQLPPSSTSSATMRQESLGPLSPATSSSMNSTRSLSPSSMSSSPYSRRLKAKTKLTDRDRKFICIFAERHPKVRQEDIAIKFAIERSTVSKILKARDKWMKVDMYSYGSKIMKHRPSKFPEIEDPLAGWVVDCAINEINLTDSLIREKAKETARSLNISEEKFKASSGWVENFKHRHSIRRGMLYIPEEIDETDETEFMTYVRKTVPDHILVRFNGGGGSTRPNAGDSGSIASGGASSTGPSEAGMHSPAMSSFSEFSTGGTSDRDRRTPSTPFYPSSLSRTSSMAPGSGGGDGDSIMPHSSPASSNGITRQTVSLGSFSPRVHPSSSSPSFGHHVGARRRNMSFDAPSPSSPLSLAFLPEARSSPSPTQMMRSEDITSAPGFPSLSPPLPSSPSSSHPSSSQTSDASGKEIPDASHACDAIDTILRFAQDPTMEGQMSPEERTTLASLQGRWGNVLRSRAAS